MLVDLDIDMGKHRTVDIRLSRANNASLQTFQVGEYKYDRTARFCTLDRSVVLTLGQSAGMT
jgi:hypothetical protein